MSYIQLTSPLVLHADPVLPGHAVTKRYVDGKKSFLQASWFTSGVVSASRMPALSGDISSAAGSGTVSLLVNGVTAGTYTKVTVDSTGRVTSGGYLIASDIPAVDWSKVVSGKPTTASGYGINNLIALSGGTASGHISSTANPTDDLHAVTKAYVDNNVTGVVSASLSVGDVVRKATDVTPSGFFRCNGGFVNRTLFGDLFSVVGYELLKTKTLDYTSYAAVGSGKPWRQQYDINTTQSTDITSWTTSASLPDKVHSSQAIVTKNRVYLLGGSNGSFRSSTVYTAPINQDGTLGTWTTSISLPDVIFNSQAIVTKNRVYLLGGQIQTDTYSSTVYTTAINSDGTLAGWTTSTPLPDAVGDSQAIVTKDRVYLLGGRINGAYSSTVYTAPINQDGTLGTWTTSVSLPDAVFRSQAIVTKNRVYLLGGQIGAFPSSSVYTAPINEDGTLGTWTTSTPLPSGVGYSQAIVTKNRVYLLGAWYNSSTVYTAPINPDGTLGTWTTSTSLPSIVHQSQAIVTKNRVYLLGGSNGSSSSSTVYTAPINDGLNDCSKLYDGSINKFDGTDVYGTIAIEDQNDIGYTQPGSGKPWRQQYDINTTQSTDITSWTTSTSLPDTLSHSQAIVTKNRVYLLGGYSGGGSSTVYTAPIHQDGTLGAWTTSTSLPGTVTESQAIVTKNRVYLLGGHINGSYSSTVYTAPINQDGTLGTWTTSTSLPDAIARSQAIVTKGRVYLLGGAVSNSGLSVVYTTPINQYGTLGEWTTSASLPGNVYAPQAIVTKNRVYLLGGYYRSYSRHPQVYTAPINADGTLGVWTASTPLPEPIAHSQAIVTKNRVYLLTGITNGDYPSSTVYTAPIYQDGTLGPWTTSTSLPVAVAYSQAIVTKNRVYLLGGRINGSYSSTIYTAPISGGLNDYSPYYDGTYVPAEPNEFKLPDYTAKETNGINFYIKY